MSARRRRTCSKVIGVVFLCVLVSGAVVASRPQANRGVTSVRTAAARTEALPAAGGVAMPPSGDCAAPDNDCTSTERAMALRAHDVVVLPLQSHNEPLSRDDAVQRVTKMTAVVRRADRVLTKSTTWGRYMHERELAGIGEVVGVGPPASTLVWLVAVEGDVQPQRSRVAGVYSWAIFVLDERTGSAMSTTASNGALPSYFAVIPDSGPA